MPTQNEKKVIRVEPCISNQIPLKCHSESTSAFKRLQRFEERPTCKSRSPEEHPCDSRSIRFSQAGRFFSSST